MTPPTPPLSASHQISDILARSETAEEISQGLQETLCIPETEARVWGRIFQDRYVSPEEMPILLGGGRVSSTPFEGACIEVSTASWTPTTNDYLFEFLATPDFTRHGDVSLARAHFLVERIRDLPAAFRDEQVEVWAQELIRLLRPISDHHPSLAIAAEMPSQGGIYHYLNGPQPFWSSIFRDLFLGLASSDYLISQYFCAEVLAALGVEEGRRFLSEARDALRPEYSGHLSTEGRIRRAAALIHGGDPAARQYLIDTIEDRSLDPLVRVLSAGFLTTERELEAFPVAREWLESMFLANPTESLEFREELLNLFLERRLISDQSFLSLLRDPSWITRRAVTVENSPTRDEIPALEHSALQIFSQRNFFANGFPGLLKSALMDPSLPLPVRRQAFLAWLVEDHEEWTRDHRIPWKTFRELMDGSESAVLDSLHEGQKFRVYSTSVDVYCPADPPSGTGSPAESLTAQIENFECRFLHELSRPSPSRPFHARLVVSGEKSFLEFQRFYGSVPPGLPFPPSESRVPPNLRLRVQTGPEVRHPYIFPTWLLNIPCTDF